MELIKVGVVNLGKIRGLDHMNDCGGNCGCQGGFNCLPTDLREILVNPATVAISK